MLIQRLVEEIDALCQVGGLGMSQVIGAELEGWMLCVKLEAWGRVRC